MGFPLLSLFGRRSGRHDEMCVVIPAYNEELLIGRCIASVLAAGLQPEHIFVVDDGSSDRTREIVAGFAGVNVETNPERLGKSRGLQRLIATHNLLTRYRFVALLDADSYVSANYFQTVLDAFDDGTDVALVCGAPRGERYNWLTAWRAYEYMVSALMYRPGQDRLGVITVAPGCASTYRTSVLSRLDWTGGTLVEDMDLTVQVHRLRLGRIVFAREAITFTQDPRTLRSYRGQMMRWNSGTWQVMRLHGLMRGGQRIDFEFGLLAVEALIYSVVMMLMPLLLWLWPRVVMQWLLFDQLVLALLVVYGACTLRRSDLLLWSPTFPVIRFVNAAIFLKAFWNEIVRGRALEAWFSVDRYEATEAV